MGNRRKSTGAVRHVDELKLVSENSIKKLIADAMKVWVAQHEVETASVKAELLEIKSSQEFLSSQYDDLKTECNRLQQTNKQTTRKGAAKTKGSVGGI